MLRTVSRMPKIPASRRDCMAAKQAQMMPVLVSIAVQTAKSMRSSAGEGVSFVSVGEVRFAHR